MIHSTIHRLLLALLMAVTAATASAYDFEVDGICYSKLSDGTSVAVTYEYIDSPYGSYSGKIVIPSEVTYDGITYTVTQIDGSAFKTCRNLSSISLPNTITSIGSGAFDYCENLKTIKIPEGVTYIGNFAFARCYNLTSINIPNTVTEINYKAFYSCQSLTSIEIPNSVKIIGDYAFAYCSKLESLNIPNSVESIGAYAFTDCDALHEVIIPSTVVSMGEKAFYLAGLNKSAFPEHLKGTQSLYGTTIYYPSDGVISTDGCIYSADKSKLYYVPISAQECKIPNSVTVIEDNAFYKCSYLTSLTIPNSVTTIGLEAFRGCTNLATIVVPNSVSYIGLNAFSETSFYNDLPDGFVYLGSVLYKYKGEMPPNTNEVIPKGIKMITAYACQECTNLKSITLPNTIVEIGSRAFSGCTGLTTFSIPPSVIKLGDYVFDNCTGLVRSAYPDRFENPYKYVPPAGYTKYYGSAKAYPSDGYMDDAGLIYNCDQSKLYFAPLLIKSASIPNSVTEIGDEAFHKCSNLNSVTIPNSVTSIGSAAFNSCSGLTSVTIPNSVKSIGSSAFYGCTSLISVTIPNSVTSIGSGAFSGCTGLTTIIIPPSVTTLGSGVFDNCTGLVRSAYPDCFENPFKYSTTYYGTAIAYPINAYFDENGVIYSNDMTKLYFAPLSLEEVAIPNTVTSIQYSAFSKCTALKSVIIPPSVLNVGTNAFYGCTGLIKSAYPDELSNPFGSNGVSIAYPFDGVVEDNFLIYNADKSTLYFAPLSIRSIVIPNSVESVHESAFVGCNNMIKGAYPNSLTNPFTSGVAISYPSDGIIDDKGNVYNSDKTKLYYVPIEATSLVIPGSVSLLDANALYACDNLIKSAYPKSIDNPFSSGLAIAYPDDGVSDESGIIYDNEKSTIYYAPFNLETATIPEGVTTIEQDAFNLCGSLTDVVIPNSVVLIKDRAFDTTPFLNNQPEGVVYLGKVLYTYKGDIPAETTIDIEDGTISINQNALKDCSNISAINIPTSVSTIGESAFENCTGIAFVAIANNITSIGDASFKGCTGLRVIDYNTSFIPRDATFADAGSHCRVVFGNNVSTINSVALKNMSDISTIVVGSKVTSVNSEGVLSGKPSRIASLGTTVSDKIIWLTSTPPENYSTMSGKVNYVLNTKYTELDNTEIYSFLGSMFEVDGIIYVPVSPAQRTCDVIDSNDSSLAEDICIGDVVYQKINLSTKKINQYAFSGCNNLNSVAINESVTTIAAHAFSDCSSFAQFTIPSNVNTIGDKAFSGCTSLTSVEISDRDDVITIGSLVFDETAVSSIYLGGNVENAGSIAKESPLYNLTTLENVQIGDKVTAINDYLFYGCSGLQNVVVPNAVVSIGNESFSGCSGLTDVSIGESVESIGEYAFDGCENVTSLLSFASEPPVCADGALNGINKFSCTLRVLETSEDKYRVADQWCNFFFLVSGANDVIDNGCTGIDIDGKALHCNGVDTDVYTLTGIKVYSGNTDIELTPGCYIVVAQGNKVTKVTIK